MHLISLLLDNSFEMGDCVIYHDNDLTTLPPDHDDDLSALSSNHPDTMDSIQEKNVAIETNNEQLSSTFNQVCHGG